MFVDPGNLFLTGGLGPIVPGDDHNGDMDSSGHTDIGGDENGGIPKPSENPTVTGFDVYGNEVY